MHKVTRVIVIPFKINENQSKKCQAGFSIYAYQTNYTANVNRQTTDKLLFSLAIITDENM